MVYERTGIGGDKDRVSLLHEAVCLKKCTLEIVHKECSHLDGGSDCVEISLRAWSSDGIEHLWLHEGSIEEAGMGLGCDGHGDEDRFVWSKCDE